MKTFVIQKTCAGYALCGLQTRPQESIELAIKRLFCLTEEQYQAWLRTPNPEFDGRTPQQEIDSGEIERFRGLLYDLESGSFT